MSWVQYAWKWFSEATPTPIRAIEVFFFLFTIIMFAIREIKPEWVGRMDSLAWQIPLGLLVVVFLISLGVSSYNLYNKQHKEMVELEQQLDIARKMAYPPITTLMMTPYFKDLDIPLGEFGLVSEILVDKTFDHCRIHGPVVLHIDGITMTLCIFKGDAESTLITTTNKRVDGVLGVRNCTFVNCVFDKVSFIGPQDQIDRIRLGFNPPTSDKD